MRILKNEAKDNAEHKSVNSGEAVKASSQPKSDAPDSGRRPVRCDHI